MIETWRHVSQSDIDEWRKRVKDNLATKRGTRYEYNTAHWQGLEKVEANQDGSATIQKPKTATGIRQHRDTVEVAAESMISWVKEDKNQFMHRVRILKQAGNFPDLTDEQAADRLWEICQKVAQADAKRVYKSGGYDRRFYREPI